MATTGMLSRKSIRTEGSNGSNSISSYNSSSNNSSTELVHPNSFLPRSSASPKSKKYHGGRLRLLGIGLASFLVLVNVFHNLSSMHQYGSTSRAKPGSKRPISQYQAWDPLRGRLDYSLLERDGNIGSQKSNENENENDTRSKPKAKMSFQLLQEILHEIEVVEERSERNEPSCFEPDFERTRRAVAFAREQWKQHFLERKNTHGSESFVPIGLPLLNMGMPKSGSSTLLRFVRHDLHWKATHNIVEIANMETNANANGNAAEPNKKRKRTYVGKLMKQAVDERLGSPFALLPPSYQAHTQMDYTLVSTSQQQKNDDNNNNDDDDNDNNEIDSNFFPQISLLDEIHAAEPNATLVVLFRPVDDWIRSVRSWHRMPARWMEGTGIPGLVLTPDQVLRRSENPSEPLQATEQQLRHFWCHHVRHVRRFVDEYPSHLLIELDLYDRNQNTTGALSEIFFPTTGNSDSKRHRDVTWGKANANPEAAISAGSRRGGPIARATKYYEEWNHTTHRLETERGDNVDDTVDDDESNDETKQNSRSRKPSRKPTSLELLETILAEQRTKKGNDYPEAQCFRPRPFAGGEPRDNNGPGKPRNDNARKVKDNANTVASAASGTSAVLLPYPILNMGLPMDPWSDALHDYLSCLGLRVVHRKALGSNGKRRIGSVGKKMREAVRDAHIGPLKGFFGPNRQAFTALDYTPSLNSSAPAGTAAVSSMSSSSSSAEAIFPQIQLLDEIHEEDPTATFVLPMPPIDEWVAWAQTFHNFTERWARSELPGLALTEEQRLARHFPCPEFEWVADPTTTGTEEPEEDPRRCLRLSDDQLRDWWCGHVEHVRRFVETHDDSHVLLELDFSNDHRESTTLALNQWLGVDADHRHCASELLVTSPLAGPASE